MDEAAIAAQVICVRQSGLDNFNVRWPIFSTVLGGGYATPSTLYLGAAWTSVFGDSIASFRAFAALHGALTVAGVFVLALALWRRRDIAWIAALCCAISPWGFLFSRIAWDPPLGPCYFVWGMALILFEGRWQKTRSLIGGLFLSLAYYSYPPIRLQAALVLPIGALVCFVAYPRQRPAYAIAGGSFLLSMLLLAHLTLSGELQDRFNILSITSDYYLRQFGGFSRPLVIRIFFENMALKLSPNYLFVNGDRNLRHSTQAAGQWSWLEMFALASAVILLLSRKLVGRRREAIILSLLVWAYLAGVIPAAMTWESNPHALRSIGAYPFLALAAGFILGRAGDTWHVTRYLIPVIAIAFSLWYCSDLFSHYPERSRPWFDTPVVDAARAAQKLSNVADVARVINPAYPPLALRYYELSSGAYRCGDSSSLKR